MTLVGDTTDDGVRNFIESFRSNPELDLGIVFKTPSASLTDFNLGWGWLEYPRLAEYLSSGLGRDLGRAALDELRFHISLLDMDLLKRHVPSYTLPWRGPEKLYWGHHWRQLIEFVFNSDHLELCLRKSS